MSVRVALAQRTLGSSALWVYAVGASSPLTVLVGGLPTTYTATGVVGVPASFVAITLVVGLLVVGYGAVSRHVPHPAPFVAILARGYNPTVALVGGLLSQLGYLAIGVSLYGLIGATLAGLVGGSWLVWALAAWAVVAVVGLQGGVANARLLGSLLAVEIAVIVFYNIAAWSNPADGQVSLAALAPSNLVVTGVSGVLAFGMAAMVGAETAPVYGEEARPGTVGRSMLSAVLFLGAFYALAALSMSVTAGPGGVVDASRDPQSGPLVLLGRVYGSSVTTIATLLLVTSVLAAIVSFHSTFARYVFGMARERLLPPGLAAVSRSGMGGAPRGGSLVHSASTLVLIGTFAYFDADPMATMFTWLSTIGAVTVLVLLVAASGAALRFFAHGYGAAEGVFVRQIAPMAGLVLGVLMIAMMLASLHSLLGLPTGSRLPLLVVALIVVVAAAGAVWGALLHRADPVRWGQVGRGVPHPLTADVSRLQTLEM
ncbi:APC family permease [Catellatospora chokoriensis]|uniref:Amino acid transporter n=1 Tax=Catellatospora chokoriensis TaxID=310353 RepID=A0A8J3K5G6_9ACTN|nr:APC family permease [Catellatospora chokoriensis]GIF89839.1 hypothetical protein Cch02nite_32830 [Catellatospora chokoriensis]